MMFLALHRKHASTGLGLLVFEAYFCSVSAFAALLRHGQLNSARGIIFAYLFNLIMLLFEFSMVLDFVFLEISG